MLAVRLRLFRQIEANVSELGLVRQVTRVSWLGRVATYTTIMKDFRTANINCTLQLSTFKLRLAPSKGP